MKGSIIHLISNSDTGAIVSKYEYDPFGGIVGMQGADSTKYLFTGQEFDAESELYYMNARYYNPKVGRFISRDRLFGNNGDLLSRNRYIYAKNNPLKYVDPTGENPEDPQAKLAEKNQEGGSVSIAGIKQQFDEMVMKIGDWGNKLYDSNKVARYAMDHPYQTGAVMGVLGGAAVAGGVVAGGGAITCGILCGTAAAETVIIGGTATKVAEEVPKGFQVGQYIDKVGIVIENGMGKIKGFNHDGTFHGLDQIINRDVSPELLKNTVSHPLIRFEQWGGERVMYLTHEASVILDKSGNVITALTKNEFFPKLLEILGKIQ